MFHIPGIERFVEDDAVSFIIYVDEKPVGVVAYTEQGENSRMCANWLSITSKNKDLKKKNLIRLHGCIRWKSKNILSTDKI